MKNTAIRIVETLQKKGFEAYFVGGCVRDLILKKEPKDFDIATNAKPEQIQELFEKTYAFGKKFGVILIVEGDYQFEVATFRSDSGYTDGRRPDFITFSTALEDAMRRDFTINGIFYDPISKKFLDFVDGMSDLKRGMLKFIGNPDERIEEDFLRILRAVRFKNRFGLEYHHRTLKAIKKHASLVTQITAERVREELTKMICHPTRDKAFEDLYDFEILEKIFPEVVDMAKTPQPKNHHMEGDVFAHTKLVLKNLPEDRDFEIYWAGFFHDFGKAFTLSNMKGRIHFYNHQKVSFEKAKYYGHQLKFPRFSIGKISWLVEHHHMLDQFEDMKMATKLRYFDHPFFEDLLDLARADIAGSLAAKSGGHDTVLKRLEMIEENCRYARAKNLLPSHQKDFFTGQEIMKILNIPAGPEIRKIKEELRELQIEKKIRTREMAEDFLRENYGKIL